MDFPKLTLERTTSCRRDLVVSVLSSIFLTTGIIGSLALVSLHVSQYFEAASSDPMTIHQMDAEDQPEEVTEDLSFAPSPAVSAAPSVATMLTINSLPVAEPVAVPDAPVPVMDDLAWSDETFEPWKKEKKPEVKKVVVKTEPTPSQVVAKKVTPRKVTSTVSPTPKPPSVKPVAARVISRSTPSYPSRARRSGIEGRVVVTVTISTSGKVSSAHISSSSSHSSLDSAALRAAKKYRFSAARNSRGQVISTKVSLPFNFKLT